MKRLSLLIASTVASLTSAQGAHAAGEGRILEIHNPGGMAGASAVKGARLLED